MWPNEQINGISFCGALMNGENHAIFFFQHGGRKHTHTEREFICLKQLVHKQ